MKLFALIPGFGNPNWDVKVEILRKNVATVSTNSPFSDYLFYIIQYTEDQRLPQDLLDNPRIHVVHDRGILAKNIHKHASPDVISNFNPDYVMILLDDIELSEPFDWDHMINAQKQLNLDVVSPVLERRNMSYWPFMIKVDNPQLVGHVTTRCELFCYFMTPQAYETYYKFCDPKNPWMWGMDFILHTHMQLRVGILNRVVMKHYFWRSESTNDPNHCPRKDGEAYLAKHATSWDQLHALPTVLQIVYMAS